MRDKYSQLSSAYHYAWFILIFQSREAAISFELIPSIYLSDLKYVIKINSSAETRPKDVKKENDNYKTENVTVSYGGKYIYLTLCTFCFGSKESNLTDTRCRIQDVVSPHCGDNIMARGCRRSSLLNYLGHTTSM